MIDKGNSSNAIKRNKNKEQRRQNKAYKLYTLIFIENLSEHHASHLTDIYENLLIELTGQQYT